MRLIDHTRAWLGVQDGGPLKRIATGALGALVGVALTGVALALWPTALGTPALIAPLGASAVLLFAVPASPLAQPWAIVGGNTLSALCGVFWMKLLGDPALAVAPAVASAIAVMSLARCLHPPGGACALTAAIGGKAVIAAGWSFALLPVALDSALLLGAGLVFHAMTRGAYPHRLDHAQPAVGQPSPIAGVTLADIEAALAGYDALLDVDSDDLEALFRQVEMHAYRRLHGVIRCAQIMAAPDSPDAPEAAVARARAALLPGQAETCSPNRSS